MRWEYTSPPGRFSSPTARRYSYTPGDQQAAKSKLKQSEDMRAPLAFLLGKLDFAKEFKSFRGSPTRHGDLDRRRTEVGESRLYRGRVPGDAGGEIHQVRVTGQDESKLDFTFSNEQLNVPVVASLFAFHPPPGVQVVEAESSIVSDFVLKYADARGEVTARSPRAPPRRKFASVLPGRFPGLFGQAQARGDQPLGRNRDSRAAQASQSRKIPHLQSAVRHADSRRPADSESARSARRTTDRPEAHALHQPGARRRPQGRPAVRSLSCSRVFSRRST